jgi:Subtilase family
VTEVSRLLRGTLPALAPLAVAAAFALPANAMPLARAVQPDSGPSRGAQWWLASLRVPQAWQSAPAEGAGVTVAVLSTGVDASNQDLSGAVQTGPDYTGSGRVPGGPYWGFEGTAVAGLIAGHGHGAGGATGSTGVAPRARILSVRVTLEYDDPLNSDTSITRRLPDAIAAGIRYAVGHGARVIDLPLDPGTLGFAGGGDPAAAGGSPAERAAVGYAAAHDVVLVAPAGDNGAGPDTVNYPAAYPGVLAVGATTRGGQLAPFTNTGSYVALTAPGSGLTLAAPGGGYDNLASTDMSAALAAGVAALIRSRFPGLTAADVAQAMEQGLTAPPGGRPAPGAGHGALNAAGALAAAAAMAARQAPTATAKPAAPRPAASQPQRGAAPKATARRSGAGTLAGSLLRDAVIIAVVLIVALAGALALSGTRRRRRAAAARSPRAGQGGSHARQPRAALTAAPTAGEPRTGTWGQPGAPGSAGRTGRRRATRGGGPQLAPPPAPGSFGPASRTRRGKRAQTGEPPWEPASPPGTAPPVVPLAAPRPALPPAGGPPRAAGDEPVPPWELAGGELAAAPVPGDPPVLPVSNTGPMYVWNPAASGPLPILDEDEGEAER